MKTIHIKGVNIQESLLKRWYNDFLKEDPLFHYVYWENGSTHKAFIAGKNILIRLEDEKVIAKLKKWLDQKKYSYEEYDYPYTRKKYQLGLGRKNWESKYFHISTQLDHLCAVAALEMSYKEWTRFVQQFLHIACNTRGISFLTQARWLLSMAESSFLVAYDQQEKAHEKIN